MRIFIQKISYLNKMNGYKIWSDKDKFIVDYFHEIESFRKTKNHYYLEVLIQDKVLERGNRLDVKYYKVHRMNDPTIFKCTLKKSKKEYQQEPDDYDDGMGIVLFPRNYYTICIDRKDKYF